MPESAAIWTHPNLSSTRFTDVRWFARLDSTNRYVLDQATAGAREGVVAVADEQTAGRGRLGRAWVAPPGSSLLVSVLLRPRLPAERLHLVTLAAALAAVDAVRDLGDVAARLKWPNDVVVDDRKLAGLLAERLPDGALVIGMGLNVRWEVFPPELADIATSCNLCATRPVDREALLVAWLRALDARLGHLDSVLDDATAHCATLGRRVRVEQPHETFEGTALELAADGALVVLSDDGRRVVVTAGDVVHLRPT